MNETALWSVVGGVAVAGVTAAGTYYALKRTTSGRIDTTEAATLWAESQKMRQELRDEVILLRSELEKMQKVNEETQAVNQAQSLKITELTQQLEKLEGKI